MALEFAASFDESGSTIVDYSGNSRNAPLTANATRVAGHTSGNALQAAGATALPLPDFGVSDARTVMAWVKGNLAQDAWLIEWHVASANSGAWGIVSIQGVIIIQAENATTQARAQIAWPDTTNWHHVAGTFDGSTVSLYLDGALADATSLTGPIRTDTNAPKLLGRTDTPAIDDVRVYSHCLDLAAINVAKGQVVSQDTFTKSAALAVDAAFINRVTASVAHYAVVLSAAYLAAPTENTPEKVRFLLARSVLSDPTGYGARFAWAIAADTGVDGTVDDGTISAKVASVWNVFAGI